MKPGRRRSVGSLKDSKHFIKAILPSPIHTKQIRIPDEFITRFGDELGNVATISVPDGYDWEIKLKKCGNDVYFCNKWQAFVEYYSIGYGSYLSFKYEGNSKFSVVIFDATSVEICYPLKNGEPNTKCRLSPRKRAEAAAIEFKPSNPYFRSKIAKRNYVYVPRDFAAKYLKPNVPIKLRNSNGEEWEVFSIPNTIGSSEMRIVRGFSKFQKANSLSHGDNCVCELIKKKPVVLKATMFRTIDYRD